MTAEAKFTLTFGGLAHARAFEVMDLIEADLLIDAIAVSINETDETKGLWETVAWFSSKTDAEAARASLGLKGQVALVPQRDWVRESLDGLKPVSAGRFFLHGSHDRHLRRAGGISLEIDAGLAFGTGHHGTTWGCLLALDDIMKAGKPKRVLDIGTGTGVLALAAARATGRKVLATDIDPEAVRVSKHNAKINGLGPLLEAVTAAGLAHSAIRKQAPFDLIFANILARPLAALATGLSALLAGGGSLVLSGLTVDQLRWIRACYLARGLSVSKVIRSGNWIVLVMKRKQLRKARRGMPIANQAKGLGYIELV